MIDKSEIGRNIRELLNGYVEKGKKLEVTLRPPDYADVFIDGGYFNTYCMKTKNFISNIRAETKNDNEFCMPVCIARDDLREKDIGYKGAEIQLPASVYELKDAFQRARIRNEKYTISMCEIYGKDISEKLDSSAETLEKLNYLANILKRFSLHEHALYRGYLEQKGLDSLTLIDLINITYNLQDCDIIYNVFNDTDLGKLYAHNGMLDWICDISEDVWHYLDYESIGQDIRMKENGIYTEDGYFFNAASEYATVYDGNEFPEPFEKDEYIFKLLIAPKAEISEAKTDGKWLSLPVSDAGISIFFEQMGVDSDDDCILYAVLSMETDIPMLVKGLRQLETLNSLARKMRDFDESGDAAKFKAVISGGICKSLDDVMEMTVKLNEFEFYPDISTPEEYARYIYKEKYSPVLPKSLEQHFNFASYAEELSATGNIYVTEYGVICDLCANERKIESHTQ